MRIKKAARCHAWRSILLSAVVGSGFFLTPTSFAQIASPGDVNQNGSVSPTTQNAANGGSRANTGSSSSVGQAPLLIIKKNTSVSAVTRGWAVGTQNGSAALRVPSASSQIPDTVTVKQNPTGNNVKNNESALTQPPTIVFSLPTCTGGQTIVGSVCACTGGLVWDGSNCVPPIPCASVKPADSSTSQSCSTYYGSPAYSGSVSVNTTWSCPSTYATPSSSVSYNASGCAAIPPCSSILPATSTSNPSCSSYFGNAGYTGTVSIRTTWSCPSTYASPVSSDSTNTSACSLQPVTCTPGSSSSTSACPAPFVGGAQYTTNTTSCPTGPFGLPSSTSSTNTSGCIALQTPVQHCPSSLFDADTYCYSSTNTWPDDPNLYVGIFYNDKNLKGWSCSYSAGNYEFSVYCDRK